MNTRHAVWRVVAVGLIGAGLWWMSRPAPAPAAEKSVVDSAAPVPKVTAPVVPTKVVASVASPLVAAAKPQEVKAASLPGMDAELNATADKMISLLEAQDYNAFVDDYLVPSIQDMTKAMAASQFAQQNLPPEAQAQFQVQMQKMEQRMPQLIQQQKDQIMKNPRSAQRFQKLAAALKVAQATPPQINATGDQAIYSLQTDGAPAELLMKKIDGKWILDFNATMRVMLAMREKPNQAP